MTREVAVMQETIDLITHSELNKLRRFTRETGQPTTIDMLDLNAMVNVQNIEIDEEHITIKYNEQIVRKYNANEHSHREWSYKYNDDTEMVAAIRRVIELAREHLTDLPENVACPPGCAECCSGYEPFVNKADVQRIADHLGMTYEDTMKDYVMARESADGYNVGWLKKTDDVADYCVFLKGTSPATTIAESTRPAARLQRLHPDRLRRRRHRLVAPRQIPSRRPVQTEAEKR